MSQPTISYEASVYTREITYTNFKGETKSVEMTFALDPLQLMSIIASIPSNKSKSKDPRKAGKEQEITEEQQIQLVRDLAIKAAGFISDDGESFEAYEGFDESLAGKAFLTKLVASDADRKEFSEKVILDPFRAFVGFARVDESNSQKDIQELEKYLGDLENVFLGTGKPEETAAEKRARLQAELAATPVED